MANTPSKVVLHRGREKASFETHSLSIYLDVFAGDEDKIMDMLDAIIDWSEKNGFKSTAVA